MTTKHRDGFAVYNTSVEGSPGQGVCGVTAPDSGLPGAAPRPARRGGGRDLRRGDDGRCVRQADWHAHSFWDESLGFSDHVGVNYDIKAMPAKWETFVNLIRRVQPRPVRQLRHHFGPFTRAFLNRDGGVLGDCPTLENLPPASLTSTGLGLLPKPWEVGMTIGAQWGL